MLPIPNEAPPPLPARSDQYLSATPPPAYSPYSGGLDSLRDPRVSSTQSLVPDYSTQEERRRLLIIYIHGFRGTESSFQSLPAHVHKLLAISLAESHIVHTKIFPRYYTRGDLKNLAADFSKWLAPHETPKTDVIICGHSLGGLMSAEVALLPALTPRAGTPFRHSILGTVSFDAPFLGLHPAVVKTGLKSLFAKYEEPADNASSNTQGAVDNSGHPGQSSSSQAGYLSEMVTDPNFNPTYTNDARLPQPRDMFKDIIHFLGKHSDNVIAESKMAIKNHWAYGRSIVTDISGMKDRYHRIRALEDESEQRRSVATRGRTPVPRVRFVNYYNACTPRQKRRESKPASRSPSPARNRSSLDIQGESEERRRSAEIERPEQNLAAPTQPVSSDGGRSSSVSPRISLEEHRGDGVIQKEVESPPSAESQPLTLLAPNPEPSEASFSQLSLATTSGHSSLTASDAMMSKDTLSPSDSTMSLPPIPPEVEPPKDLDPSQYPDKEALKLAEKMHAREVKAYLQAVKNREAAIKERQKYENKIRKAAEKMEESRLKAEEKEKKKQEKAQAKASRGRSGSKLKVPSDDSAIASPSQVSIIRSDDEDDGAPTIASPQAARIPATDTSPAAAPSPRPLTPNSPTSQSPRPQTPSSPSNSIDPPGPPPKKKTQKFCILPSKINGQHDPAWVRVLIEGMDPPVAHTAIFSPASRTYEQLVGDVAARIEEWVGEELSRRYLETFKEMG